jgi:hypothetical protein
MEKSIRNFCDGVFPEICLDRLGKTTKILSKDS